MSFRRRQSSSCLRDPGRHIAIFTTASLPWMTGTSVNPLLRAAYLANHCRHSKVTLVVPWLSPQEQDIIYPAGIRFQRPEEQTQYIRDWVGKRVEGAVRFEIELYSARYDNKFESVMPVGDLTDIIPDAEADVAILEEPEHLTWFHHGRRWTDKFSHVVGIAHTNYIDYVGREASPLFTQSLAVVNQRLCNVHCHKVIKLSDAVQRLPRQSTCFVHGVAARFFEVGDAKARARQQGRSAFSQGAYFLGKGVWGKGYTELLEQLRRHQERGGAALHLDVYGSGPDMPQIKKRATGYGLNITFHDGRDHVELGEHKVFVNPSTSDVVATTTGEALAMGKWVVCAVHPSNSFFADFANVLVYSSPEEFSACLAHAQEHKPHPLVDRDRERLTWEAATQRFLDAASIAPHEWPSRVVEAQNVVSWRLYNTVTGLELLRRNVGAGKLSKYTPDSVAGYNPDGYDRRQLKQLDDNEFHAHQGYPAARLL